MEKTNIHNRIVIIQDSIFNSVFTSQIIQPLQGYIQKNPKSHVTIISFEKGIITAEKIKETIPQEFTFIQLRKKPFLGLWSLICSVTALKRLLSTFQNYDIIARGPIAGYLAVQARTIHCKKIVIQARGLLAEEYGYTHKESSNLPSRLWHATRQELYHILEKATYSFNIANVTFEAVSPALKEHLIDTYDIIPHKITIAQDDIPIPFLPEEKQIWRAQIRKQLGIQENTYVYCYNGSAKAWQCPLEIVQFFYEELQNNPKSLLLILSQDTNIFLSLLKQYYIPSKYYRVLYIAHEKIFWYLAAADAGLLFRKSHIINWISRPTKALEYQALQLPIIHNNTVAYLVNEPRYNSSITIKERQSSLIKD